MKDNSQEAPRFTPDEAALIQTAIGNIGLQTSLTSPDFEKIVADGTAARTLWKSIALKLEALTDKEA